MAEGGAEMRFSGPARAKQQDRATSVDPSVARGKCRNVRATEHGNGGKIKTLERFAGWQARLKQMSLDTSLITRRAPTR